MRGRAHISFADTLSGPQFCRIVVQENLGVVKHHPQRVFLGPRPGEPLIQLLVAAGLPKQVVKGRSQRIRLGRTGMVSVGQQVSIERPELLREPLEEVAMGQKAWCQFLVVAIFMDPAQGQLDRQPVELGRIITQEQFDHWVGRLTLVGRDRQGLFHTLAQRGPIDGQVPIQHLVEVALGVWVAVRQQRGKQATPLRLHAELGQQGHRRGHSSQRPDQLLPEAREATSSDLWPATDDRRYTTDCTGYDTARCCH